MPFCQFFFEPSDGKYCMILLEFNLNLWKLKYISFGVKFQSLLAAVECVASIKSTFTNILSKDAKRFVNLTFFIVFPKRRKLFISLSQGIFYNYAARYLKSRLGNQSQKEKHSFALTVFLWLSRCHEFLMYVPLGGFVLFYNTIASRLPFA